MTPAPATHLDDDISWVRLDHVLALADPGDSDVWSVDVITLEDLRAAFGSRRHEPHPGDACRACHVQRILDLARLAPDDADPHPIHVDVGMADAVPHWPILDGNHRLLSAALRGEGLVPVRVDGDLERAELILVSGLDWDHACDLT